MSDNGIYLGTPPDRSDGATGKILTDIKGRLQVVIAAGAALLGKVGVSGAAKGATTALDVTATAQGADHNGLDVMVRDAAGGAVGFATETTLSGVLTNTSDTASGVSDVVSSLADVLVATKALRWATAAAVDISGGDATITAGCTGLLIASPGNLKFDGGGLTAVTVPVGVGPFPLPVTKVYQTGTTCTISFAGFPAA